MIQINRNNTKSNIISNNNNNNNNNNNFNMSKINTYKTKNNAIIRIMIIIIITKQ